MSELKLTAEQANAIVEAHEIDELMRNDEEAELLLENNPELHAAYTVLLAISISH